MTLPISSLLSLPPSPISRTDDDDVFFMEFDFAICHWSYGCWR